MKFPALASLLVLTASASAQTITRSYSVHEILDDSYAGPDLGAAQYSSLGRPDVTDGPFVTTLQYGGTVSASRTYEADFVNNSSTPLVVDLGGTNRDSWFVIGDENGCGTGFDSCFNACQSWEGLATVAPNSVHTEVWNDAIATQTYSSNQTCLFGAAMTAAFLLEHSFTDASEVRWTSRLETSLEQTVELSLNPNVTKLCTDGVVNSLGSNATLEWYGSLDAGSRNAAILANSLPPETPAYCVMTNSHDPAPAGLGTVPVSCVRGFRFYQYVQWTDAAGTATFDLDLGPTAAGFTFYTQVIYRDLPAFGGWNASDLVEATAQ